jgi:hypothetical protein
MAYKGTAAKSSSGASMSQYDVEVEERLKALETEAHKKPTGATSSKVDARLDALEAALEALTAKCNAPAPKAAASSGSDARLDALIVGLNKVTQVTDNFPKGEDGIRRIDV